MNTLRKAIEMKEAAGGWAPAGYGWGPDGTRGCLVVMIGRAIREDYNILTIGVEEYERLCHEAKDIVREVLAEQHPELASAQFETGEGILVDAHTNLPPIELDRIMDKAAVIQESQI